MLNRYLKINFDCDKCGKRFHQTTTYSPDSSLELLRETYCVRCVKKAKKETEEEQTKSKKTKDFGTPPVEASENLRSIEVDKRTLRKTNRIHQFNTSVSEDWMKKLKSIAYQERLKYVEVLERVLEAYLRERENKVKS